MTTNTPTPADSPNDKLEPIDYLANRFADGVMPGGAKYIFSSEDWLAFKDAVRAQQAAHARRRDAEHLEAIDRAIDNDGWVPPVAEHLKQLIHAEFAPIKEITE